MRSKYYESVIIVLVLSTGYFWYQSVKLPVEGVVCSIDYSDCLVVARYKNMHDCENERKMSSLLCDSRSAEEGIVCKVAKDSAVRSYCRD